MAADTLLTDSGDLQRWQAALSANEPNALEFMNGCGWFTPDLDTFTPVRTPLDCPSGPHRPSDDPRAYASLATYYRPDPDAPGGLPYISIDARYSPYLYDYDTYDFDRAAGHIFWLGRRAFLAGDDRALGLMSDWVDAWFFDGQTSLRPHLRHAQFIPGVRDGWAVGTIDFSVRLPGVIDMVRANASRLPGRVVDGFAAWADALLEWLIDGPYTAWLVAAERNNIGTYYDLLVACLAIHVDRPDVARGRLSRLGPDRIKAQIGPGGNMDEELRRRISLTYSTMNLIGMLENVSLARRVGIDLRSDDPDAWERLRAGVGSLLPALTGGAAWEHPQVKPMPRWFEAPLIRHAERLLGFEGLGDRWLNHVGIPGFPGVMAAVLTPHVQPPPPADRTDHALEEREIK